MHSWRVLILASAGDPLRSLYDAYDFRELDGASRPGHQPNESFHLNHPSRPCISSNDISGPAVLFADGTKERLGATNRPEALKAMISIKGGEVIGDFGNPRVSLAKGIAGGGHRHPRARGSRPCNPPGTPGQGVLQRPIPCAIFHVPRRPDAGPDRDDDPTPPAGAPPAGTWDETTAMIEGTR